jgi:hypothetical protein
MKQIVFALLFSISLVTGYSQINVVHQPWPAITCEGGNIYMSVMAEPAGLIYAWEVRYKNMLTWTPINSNSIDKIKKLPGFENIIVTGYNSDTLNVQKVGYQMDSVQFRCKITLTSPSDVTYSNAPYARVHVTPGLDLANSILKGCDTNDIRIEIDPKYDALALTKCTYQLMPEYSFINDTNPATILSHFPLKARFSGYYAFITMNRVYSGCSRTDTFSVNIQQPYPSEQIGTVTLDPASNKWAIIWRRTTGVGTRSCRILQDDGMGGEKLIGEVPYASNVGYFVDKTSSSSVPPRPYSIQLTDSCGHISTISVSHSPIFLKQTPDTIVGMNGVQLKFTPYVGFAYNWYYIHCNRSRSAIGLLSSIIDSVPSTDSIYVVPNAKLGYYYAVSVRLPSPLMLVTMLKAESGPNTQSLSNITEYKGKLVNKVDFSLPADIFPNPFSEELYINYTLDKNSDVKIEIVNALGEKSGEFLLKKQSAGQHTEKLDPSIYSFSEGINMIIISTADKTTTIKCVYVRK